MYGIAIPCPKAYEGCVGVLPLADLEYAVHLARIEMEFDVKILAYLAQSFIATFGITQPRPEQERLTNVVLGGFLLAVIVGAFSLVGFLVWAAF